MNILELKNYEYYFGDMIRRLDGFYGAVDARMNDRIEQWVKGKRVLDVGCGFGQLVEHLREKGYSCTGIDLLESHITTGKVRFPDADLRLSKGALDFNDKSIDTVILKDTIHHIYDEIDIDKFFSELIRVCRQRVIIMDPNPSPILLFARKLIGLHDPVCKFQAARTILLKHGFTIVHETFTDVVAFPLSGGFVSKQFIKNPKWYAPILKFDEALERFAHSVHLQSLISWRYMLVGDLSLNGN